MRTRSIAALVLAASVAGLAAHAQEAPNSLDKRGGFRDAKLGITFEEFKALDKKSEPAKTREKGKFVYYKRSGDEMLLFGSKLDSLEYVFRDAKLVAVVMKTAPEKRVDGAADLYATSPDIVRVTAGFEDQLRDARIGKLDEIREKRLRALAQTEFKADAVNLDWTYEGRSLVTVVMPIRIDANIPGHFSTQIVVIYLQKGIEFGEI